MEDLILRIEKLIKKVIRKKNELIHANAQIESLKDEVEELKGYLYIRDGDIKELEKELDEKHDFIAKIQSELEEKDIKIEEITLDFKKEVAEKVDLAELDESLSKLENELE